MLVNVWLQSRADKPPQQRADLQYESPYCMPHVTEPETADTRKGCSGDAGLQARQNVKRVRAARQHHLQGLRRLLGGWDLRLVEAAGLTHPPEAARTGSDGVFTGA